MSRSIYSKTVFVVVDGGNPLEKIICSGTRRGMKAVFPMSVKVKMKEGVHVEVARRFEPPRAYRWLGGELQLNLFLCSWS